MTVPFEFLSDVNVETILMNIADEHPQTIALVLSCVRPAQAAHILEGLPPERQLSVIRRIATLWQVAVEIVQILEEELRAQISDVKYMRVGGIDAVAEMLLGVDPGTSKNILENLNQDDPELVEDIRISTKVVKTLRKREKENA